MCVTRLVARPLGGYFRIVDFLFAGLLACLICLPALITIAWSDGRSTSAVVCIKPPLVRGRRRGHHPAPHRMPFNKRSFFLAASAIELALLLGYGRSQYTGNWINVINTTTTAESEVWLGDRHLLRDEARPPERKRPCHRARATELRLTSVRVPLSDATNGKQPSACC